MSGPPARDPLQRLRIAVVTPLPVSGIEGGNERHWRSLTSFLSRVGHDARLVAEVSPEADFHEVLASYARFHRLDLSDADVVISGKYPSFMVHHDRHIRHLNHPLRGLYEHYPAGTPVDLDPHLVGRLDSFGDDVDAVIEWAATVAGDRVGDPAMDFPGPFARAVIHRLDRIGRDRLVAEAAVSEIVAGRPGYVDPARPIAIIPPLGDLEELTVAAPDFGDEPGDQSPFLFTFGRLDRAKRVDLILRSFAMARRLPGMGRAELVIAGDGPMQTELAAAAGPAVRLVGRLDDHDLADHLRRAAAVVLTPIDEDYGLVAAEAMAAGRPVITTSDSGGIAEQVIPDRTGLIVHPRAPLLAKAMRDLVVDRDRAARMGRAGRDAVTPLSWDPMLALIERTTRPADGRRVLLISTFPADPVESGGQRRLRGMAAGLVEHGWEPVVLSLTNRLAPELIRRRRTADGVEHVMVGRSSRHLRADFAMASLLGSPIDDVACAELWPSTATFEPEIRAQVASADAVILSHPFLVSALTAAAPITDLPPVIYDAFNVESELKKEMFADRRGGSWVTARAATAESAAIELAAAVSATSRFDLEHFERAGLAAEKGVIAPNPLDPTLTAPRTDVERRSARQRFLADLGLAETNSPLVVFIGSDHPPNRAAARRCAELAAARPDLHVVIAGTVAVDHVVSPSQPSSIGSFDARDLRRLQVMADVVLNPVEIGSGTSLKLIDPLALGVPVVSTAIGARGIDDANQAVWLTSADAASLGSTIDAALSDSDGRAQRVERGLGIAQRAFPASAMAALSSRLDELTPQPTNS